MKRLLTATLLLLTAACSGTPLFGGPNTSTTLQHHTPGEALNLLTTTITADPAWWADELTRATGETFTPENLESLHVHTPVAVRSMLDTSELHTLQPDGLNRKARRNFRLTVTDRQRYHSGLYLYQVDRPDGTTLGYAVTNQSALENDHYDPSFVAHRAAPTGYLVTYDGFNIEHADPDTVRVLDLFEAGWTVHSLARDHFRIEVK